MSETAAQGLMLKDGKSRLADGNESGEVIAGTTSFRRLRDRKLG